MRYQKHFSGTKAPPVARNKPSQCVTVACGEPLVPVDLSYV